MDAIVVLLHRGSFKNLYMLVLTIDIKSYFYLIIIIIITNN